MCSTNGSSVRNHGNTSRMNEVVLEIKKRRHVAAFRTTSLISIPKFIFFFAKI